MRNSFQQILILMIVSVNFQTGYSHDQPVDYVDPFIGTEGQGHVFPGASMPFGMVKLGPDCKGHSNPGYISGGIIEGFSHTHVSGTGGGAKYGNIMVTPWVGNIDLNDEGSSYSREQAEPGYYAAYLNKQKVYSELTVTHNAGFHRYTFPESERSSLMIDAGHFLFFGDQWGEAQELVGSEIKIVSDTEIEGYSRVRHGWNFGGAYTVYFYARLQKPAQEMGTWKGKNRFPKHESQVDTGEKTGAWVTFSTTEQEEVLLKVGISFVSLQKAKANLEKDIPHWDFERTRNNASKSWNDLLSKISLEAGEEQKTVFYTNLYHVYLMPVDRTGENPKWTSDSPYYDDFYAIWDTYRTSHPLMTILTPDRQIDMLNALLDIYVYEGYLPDARSGNYNGRTQGGSNADVLIHDDYVKGLDGIDYELALEAMLKNAEVPPGGDERNEGRGGLWDYNRIGYVSTDYERAGSRTLEYSYCDYCIAKLAEGLGKDEIHDNYIQKASSWLNLWDGDYASHGAKGFIMPKKANGQWHKNLTLERRTADGGNVVFFDEFTRGYWEAFFYESDAWEYSFFVPHDANRLIMACGGKEAFIQRLDTFFINDFFQVSNEPGFLTPHLYTYAGVHDKTAARLNQILDENYHTGRDGLPGNDDSGAMGAWFVFNSMGFYPNAGQDVYLIGTPLFEEVRIHLSNEETFRIKANALSDNNYYIESAYLNGRPLKRAWLKHEEITSGGKLELNMSDTPGKWDINSVPPSLSSNTE